MKSSIYSDSMESKTILILLGFITCVLAAEYSQKSCRQECSASKPCQVGHICKAVGCNRVCQSSGVGSKQVESAGSIGGAAQDDSLSNIRGSNDRGMSGTGGLNAKRGGDVADNTVGLSGNTDNSDGSRGVANGNIGGHSGGKGGLLSKIGGAARHDDGLHGNVNRQAGGLNGKITGKGGVRDELIGNSDGSRGVGTGQRGGAGLQGGSIGQRGGAGLQGGSIGQRGGAGIHGGSAGLQGNSARVQHNTAGAHEIGTGLQGSKDGLHGNSAGQHGNDIGLAGIKKGLGGGSGGAVGTRADSLSKTGGHSGNSACRDECVKSSECGSGATCVPQGCKNVCRQNPVDKKYA